MVVAANCGSAQTPDSPEFWSSRRVYWRRKWNGSIFDFWRPALRIIERVGHVLMGIPIYRVHHFMEYAGRGTMCAGLSNCTNWNGNLKIETMCALSMRVFRP